MALKITEEDRYLFDLQGFLILENILTEKECDSYAKETKRLAKQTYDDSWMKQNSLPTVSNDLGFERINGLINLSNVFDNLINHSRILPYLNEFMDGQPQLINTWAIKKTGSLNNGGWHRGISPRQYSYRNGKIRSEMLNVVFFLTDNNEDDGCVWAVPASHKDNIDLSFSKKSPPHFIKATGKKGSAIIFSEAMIHCGGAKTSNRTRTNLYFNYIHKNYQTHDVDNLHHFLLSPNSRLRFNEEQKSLTKWMNHYQIKEPALI